MGSVEEKNKCLQLLQSFIKEDVDKYDADILYSTLKNLRDLGIKTKQFEKDSSYKEDALACSVLLLNNLYTHYNDKFLPAIGQALQFLHNLTVRNSENQSNVWQKCNKYIKSWIQPKNDKIMNYVCGLLFNITFSKPTIFYDIISDHFFYSSIMDSAQRGTDFPVLLEESLHEFLSSDPEKFMHNFISRDNPLHFEVMNLICYYVQQRKNIDGIILNWTEDKFKAKAQGFLSKSNIDKSEVEELFCFQKILVELSRHDEITKKLQTNTDLLVTTKEILERLQNEGKKSNNIFTPAKNIMTERISVENMKSNLIRLLGNLCWKSQAHQDKIRELDGIPLILDCCIRDGNNPFITESAIFAIRNLCEGNFENQDYIRNMNEVTHFIMSERAQNWPSIYLPDDE